MVKIQLIKLPDVIDHAASVLPSPIGGSPESIIKNIILPMITGHTDVKGITLSLPAKEKVTPIVDEHGNIVGLKKQVVKATIRAIKNDFPEDLQMPAINELLVNDQLPDITLNEPRLRLGLGLGPRDGMGPRKCLFRMGYPVANRPLRWLSVLYSLFNNDYENFLPLIHDKLLEDIKIMKNEIENTSDLVPGHNPRFILNILESMFGTIDNFINTVNQALQDRETSTAIIRNLSNENLKKLKNNLIDFLAQIDKEISNGETIDAETLEKISNYKFEIPKPMYMKIKKYAKLNKQVQTFIPSLLQKLSVYDEKEFPKIAKMRELLEELFYKHNYVTIKEAAVQKLLVSKYAEDLNVDPSVIEPEIYNTNRMNSELEVIHIDGVPIDLEKFKSMNKQELASAVSPVLADLVYDEQGKLKTDTLVDILQNMAQKAKSDKLFKETVVDPILVFFSKNTNEEDIIG